MCPSQLKPTIGINTELMCGEGCASRPVIARLCLDNPALTLFWANGMQQRSMNNVYGLPTECNVMRMTSSLLCRSISSFLACSVALLLAFLLRLYKHFTYRLAMYQVVGSLVWEICVIMLSCTELSNHSSMFYQA